MTATTTIAPPSPKRADLPPPTGGNGRGSWGRPEDEPLYGRPSGRTSRLGIWVALAPIVMLFISFTSAMVVRRGLSDDWVPTELPNILWINTLVILLSSVTLVFAKRALMKNAVAEYRCLLGLTTLLGIAFFAGQFVAWWQLASAGVYVYTNPSSSFFYVLTVAHGVHLLGGVAALVYLNLKVWRRAAVLPVSSSRTAFSVTAVYWHFMDVLWVYLFLLLTLWR